ncbi:MAG: peroxidase family protein, partial [Terricaulis sp.]
MASLKPFVLNLDDLEFIFRQVTFRPLFDIDGNAIINWNGVGSVYDGHGVLIGVGGVVVGDVDSLAAIEAFGRSYASATDLSGIRDVSGFNNNLLRVHAYWGTVDQPFARTVAANYANFTSAVDPSVALSYGAQHGGFDLSISQPGVQYAAATDYTPTVSGSSATAIVTLQNVVDYTPRMISRTVTTAGVIMLTEGDLPGYAGATPNHIVYNTPFLSDGATANPNYNPADVEGVSIVSDYGLLGTLGHTDYQKTLANGAPDPTQSGSADSFIGAENPGVAPTNGWFALFGQFFDHGLDFIDKSSGKTIKIALAQDDPLYGVLGPDGRPVTAITITRATPAGADVNGDVAYVNHTSPFIDQSQTYGSSDQMTNLLRKWVSDDGGETYHAGMNLFDGTTLATQWKRPDGSLTNDTLPTLNELRDHVLDTQRDGLTWEDVSNLRNRDANGAVTTGASDQALLLDMNPRFDGAHLDAATAIGASTVATLVDDAVITLNANLASTISGMPGNGALNPTRVGAGDSFAQELDGRITLHLGEDLVIATGPTSSMTIVAGDYSGANALMLWVDFSNFSISAPAGAVHDAVGQILLAAVGDHYIAGDGRVNENFGLTAIHHVFHEEHNFQIQNLQNAIYAQDAASGDASHAILHQWQVDTGATDGAGNYIYANGAGAADDVIAWDQEKMFKAAKLVVEMEYQHAAIDQYARTITPHILEVVGYSSGVDPSVSLEFSQAAFRFGHSTIRETIDTIDPNHGLTGKIVSYALELAFLNPGLFAATGPAAIALGMSHQQMNEVDEFITPALNQGLLGQPLDLAAINIARGRDIGIPTLNEFRAKVGLTQYVSWDDFGRNMIHPESLVSFIAAYAFDGDVAKAQALAGLFDGSIAEGDVVALGYTLDQALAFMLNDAGAPAGADAFNLIDTWIGGLAEAHVPGGLLGSTFDLVFVNQMENLINGDRFYYLVRLFGQQFGEEVNNGQLKDIVERNTGLEHLNGSIFAYADKYYDFGAQDSNTALDSHKTEHKYAEALAANPTLGIWSDGSANPLSINGNGAIITVGGVQYIRDFRPDLAPGFVHPVEGTPTSGAESHEVMVGTDRPDYVHLRSGDDTFYGEGGADKIFGDFGNDRLYGGDGADTIDSGDGADLVDGGAGDDIIYGFGSGTEIGGFDQLVGGFGNDTIWGGEGIDKLSGGAGDDALYGEGNTDPFTHGGDGNDYIDGGSSGDNLYGDAGDDFVYGSDDQDIVQGDSGDDILRPGKQSQAINGGPDEVIGGTGFVDDGFDLMDLSDWDLNPLGVIADMITQANPMVNIDGTTSFPAWFQVEGVVGTQNNDTLIGLDAVTPAAEITLFGGGNWLIGGSGNDTITGAGGNDVIVGGSIRLDTLIGAYNNPDGAAGGVYDHILADGTTHRAAPNAALSAGLLGAAILSPDFDKHFTEMLRTERFKDLMLGDGGVDGAADVAVFSGNWLDYSIVALDAFGNVIASPSAALASIFAVRLADNGGLNLDGTARVANDGVDLVLGVEVFRFEDGDRALAQLFNHTPTGGVAFAAEDNNPNVFGNNDANAVRLTPTNTIADLDGVASAIVYTWLDGANAAIATVGSTTLPYVDTAGAAPRLVLHTTAGALVQEVATYTDGGGFVETVSKTWNMVVGASGDDSGANQLTGTTSTAIDDVIFGLAGDDTLNGLAGDDRLYGGANNDTLNGGDGADVLVGGTGADQLNGGNGA